MQNEPRIRAVLAKLEEELSSLPVGRPTFKRVYLEAQVDALNWVLQNDGDEAIGIEEDLPE